MTHVLVSELPSVVTKTLSNLGYKKKDIGVSPVEEISLLDLGGAGRRGFVALINLETDEVKITYGSWGGANMFNPTNVVDLDDRSHKLPVNGIVIKGSQSDKTFASIYVHPENMPKYLPAPSNLNEKEKGILYAFNSLKSGIYRTDHLKRIGCSEADIQALIDKKLLIKSGRGISITLAGKNAR